MLRALMHDALAAAMQEGFARISFKGYGIEARRLSPSGSEPAYMALTLTAEGGAALLDRVRIAVAFESGRGAASRINRSHAQAVAARRPEFLAGCVSPNDARYASPETGQIS